MIGDRTTAIEIGIKMHNNVKQTSLELHTKYAFIAVFLITIVNNMGLQYHN